MSLTYSGGGVTPQPKLAWSFDGTTTDYVSGLAPTSVGGSPTYVAGKYGQGLNFPNSVNTGTSNPTNNVVYTVSLNATTGFTFAFWVNFNFGGVFAQVILSLANASGVGLINIYLNGSNGLVSYDDGANLNFPSFTFSTGTWYHVALSVANGSRTVYINGQSATASTVLTGTTTNRFILGGDLPSQANYSAWCSYDDLRIFDQALTSAQVQSIYNQQGVPGRGSLVNVVGSANTSLTGTPLFSQLSQAATSSAVGAFSLRAVNGTSVKAVAVQAHPVGIWPPTVLSGFTTALSGQTYGNGTYTVSSSETENGNTNRQSWDLFKIGTDSALNGHYHSATVFNGNSPNNYTGAATTTINGGSVSGLWIQLQAPTSIILKSYQMITRASYSLTRFRFPSTYYIIGSNDGTTWVQLDYKSYTNANYDTLMTPIVVAGETRYQLTVNIVNYTAYTYYRLVVQNIISGDILNFSNFWLYGESPSYAPNAAQDFYADRLGNLLTAPVTGQSLANWLGGATGYVTTWYDQSGAGNHATQATAANQPVIQRATKGPGYMCLYSGAQGLTGMSYTVLNGTNYSVVINERRTTSAIENYYIGSGNGATNNWLILGYRYNNTLTHAQYANDYDMTVPVYAGGSEPMRYTSYTFSSTNGKFTYNNGTLLGSLTDANGKTGLSSTSGNFTIGSGYKYYTGEIYEILVFTNSLYDLDNTGGLITQVYQNQLSYTGT